MSYDIDLAIDTGGRYMAVVADIGSPTYNLGPMFRMALAVSGISSMQGHTKPSLSGMLAADAIPVLANGLKDMRDRRAEYEKLNPPNGWGRYENAVETFEKLLEACEAHPKATVRV